MTSSDRILGATRILTLEDTDVSVDALITRLVESFMMLPSGGNPARHLDGVLRELTAQHVRFQMQQAGEMVLLAGHSAQIAEVCHHGTVFGSLQLLDCPVIAQARLNRLVKALAWLLHTLHCAQFSEQRYPLATPAALQRMSDLTRRQREVLALMVQGMSVVQIAARFNCSELTVRRHQHDIYRRLGVRCADEAIVLGRLVDPPPPNIQTD